MRITAAAEPVSNTSFREIVMGGKLFEFWRHLRRWSRLPKFKPGDLYLDGTHVVLCTEVDFVAMSMLGPWDYDLAGISLLDGSAPHSTSVLKAAPCKVSMEFAILWLATQDRREEVLQSIYEIFEQNPELQKFRS